MVGGTIFHRRVIQREISRALVLNLLWHDNAGGACAPPRITMSLTEPSLLSRGSPPVCGPRLAYFRVSLNTDPATLLCPVVVP